MTPDPDESGIVPDDDRLLVRPYVPGSDLPSGPAYPAWPDESGRISVPTRFGPSVAVPEPPLVPAPEPASVLPGAASDSDRHGSRLPFVGLALLALGAAGVLALVLLGPDEEPPRAVAPPGLSVPVLPARSPGAGEAPSPPAESAPPALPAATSATAPPAAGPPTAKSPDPKPPGPTGAQPPEGAGTLSPGDRGAEVRALQERLYAQGFTYVSLTGVYDDQTRRGVTQLQQNRSIKGDPLGVYGPATRAVFPTGG